MAEAAAPPPPEPGPASPPAPRRPRAPRPAQVPAALQVPLAALAAMLLALVLRLPARSLPIEGDAVAYGALARSLAGGDGFTLDGAAHDRYPPGWPAVLAVPVALGASVTAAVRGTAWLLGGVAAALLVVLGARWSRGRLSLPLLVALAAAHPDLALFAGGLVPGSEALTLVMLVGAILLAGTARPGARLTALVLAGLLPLIRYDALPFAAGAAWLAWSEATGPRVRRARGIALAVAFGPLLLWAVRTWIATGAPWGGGYAHHGLDLGRLPKNLLVFLGLIVPVGSLVLLLPYAAKGLRTLWRGREARSLVRTVLLAAAAHLFLVLLFAGPTGSGGGALKFSSGSLRFGLAAWPFVFVAAAMAVTTEKPPLRRFVVGAAWVLTVPLALHAVSGGLQRALPAGPLAAARLHALAEAFDAAVATAGPTDWIGFDLLPRTNEGVEVFLGERAPRRVTGTFVGPRGSEPRGRFPRAPVLPVDGPFPKDGQILLVTDVPREGTVFTGDRPDLGIGGRGIFHRVRVLEVDAGRAGVFRVDAVKRPSAR